MLAATKDKNGYVVKLAIHPNDVPENFVKDLVGTRYQFAGVKLKDDGSFEKKLKGPKRDEVQHAALLCKNPIFWQFMEKKYDAMDQSERCATEALREYLGVESRSELADSELARRRFHELVSEYERWAR